MTTYAGMLIAQVPAAATGANNPFAGNGGQSMAVWLLVLAAMALLPFVLTMVTSFAKLVIVGGILRQALGTQNIPPNTVLTGLALLLTVHIMAPTAARAYQTWNTITANQPADRSWTQHADDMRAAVQPALHSFLSRQTRPSNILLFRSLSDRLSRGGPSIKDMGFKEDVRNGIDDLTILAPAFILTELTEAFQIGFIIFVPFLVIDLVVSNILLAMGMHMLSPQTVSLPLKLLLFVAIDGWRLVLQGLALGYT